MFTEDQGFSAFFVLSIGLTVLLCFGFAAYFSYNSNSSVGSMVPLFIIPALILLSLLDFRVKTQISSNEVIIKFWRFSTKRVLINEIANAEAVKYNPISDFGGWGIRNGLGGTMYSARGNMAVKLTLKSGDIIYLGTSRPDELVNAIRIV